jgi:mono/diheme cytochrome c family protein
MRVLLAIAATTFLALPVLRPADPPAPPQDSRPAPGGALALPGYKAYVRHCAPCHGERGDGKGVAARFLDPAPRDFKQEAFRFVSTANGAPSPKDLFEVVGTGIGGTAMIPFASLGEETIWPIVEVVEAFRLEGVRTKFEAAGFDAAAVAAEVEKRKPVLAPDEGAPPSETYESAARGLVHYRAYCAGCHGVEGRGVMPTTVPEGVKPMRPRDLTRGVTKQFATPENLFARIRCGMPGSGMPAISEKTLDAAGVWDVVHYLRSIMPPTAQALASPSVRTLAAARLEGPVPSSPDDPRFAGAAREWIAFAPFRDTEPGPPGAFVQTLAGERVLAFRFVVPDPTIDVPAPDVDVPPDGVAVRVTGSRQAPVLPLPGQLPRIDRAMFLTGPLPEGRSAIYTALPRFENPESVCRMVLAPDRGGAAYHREGSWHVVLAVSTDQAGSPLGKEPLFVSFAPFDGSLRRGPMPVALTPWHRLMVR